MGMTFKALCQKIEFISPGNLAESWDNNGLQIVMHEPEDKVGKVLVALEITKDVINEAKSLGMEVIVTHHPLIFGKLSRVDNNDVIGNYVAELVKAGISVYSAHTSFDSVLGGNNTYLAELLGLKGVKRLDESREGFLGVFGQLPSETTAMQLCKELAVRLQVAENQIRLVGEKNHRIKTVGLCTGAGAEFMELAIQRGCDAYITGDVKYHEAMEARARGIVLIDGGHFGTERIFAENFAAKLEKAAGEYLNVLISRFQQNPFQG